jgi:hypothetical protein
MPRGHATVPINQNSPRGRRAAGLRAGLYFSAEARRRAGDLNAASSGTDPTRGGRVAPANTSPGFAEQVGGSSGLAAGTQHRIAPLDPTTDEGRQIAAALTALLDDLRTAVQARALSAGLPYDVLEHARSMTDGRPPLSDEAMDRLRAIVEPVAQQLAAVMASIDRSDLVAPGTWPPRR